MSLDQTIEDLLVLGVVTRNPVTGALQVNGADVTGIPSYDWADIPDPAVVAINSRINIPAAQFPHTSIPLGGMDLKADGVVWRREGGAQVLAEKWNLDGTGVATVAAGSTSAQAFTLAEGVPTLLAGMLYVGMSVEIQTIVKNVNGNGTAAINVHFGTLGTTSDPIVAFSTSTAVADRDSSVWSFMRVVSSTRVLTSPFTGYNNSGQTNATANQAITSGPAVVHKFTIAVTPASASDNFQLTGYRFALVA